VDIKVKFSGLPDDWTRKVTQQATEQALREARRRVEGLRCPVHGSAPKIQERRDGLTIESCCEDLKNLVAAATRGR
jgi:hypothetical protein